MNITKKLIISMGMILLVCMLFAPEVKAQEQKGFFVRMWDRFKSRSEEKQSGESGTKAPVPTRSAAPVPSPKVEPVESVFKARVPVSKERMISAIEKATQAYPEIFELMPELLVRGTMQGGSELHYGPQDGVKLKISSLDDEELFDLFKKVNMAVSEVVKQQQEVPPVVSEMEEIVPKEVQEQPETAPKPITVKSVLPVDSDEFGKDLDFAEDLPAEEPASSGDATTRPEIPISKEKMLEIIKRRLDIYSEILFMIPGLTFRETEGGAKQFYYAPEGQIAQKIEDVDKESLHKVFVRTNNEATRINTQRLMRQLQQQQMVMRQMQSAIQQPPQPPPQPPRIYTPPQPQRIYTPPQPPPQPPQYQQPPQQPQHQQPPQQPQHQQPPQQPQVTGPPK